jgi:glycosyltransferase involved in cell wall biosynthesis
MTAQTAAPELHLEHCPLVVVIPTRDEELHIQRVIDSSKPLGAPVVVVDSFSGDRTQEIARAAGATVVERAWAGYADQKNWVLDQIRDRAEWVLFLDADEYLTDALVDEIVAVRDGTTAADGCLLPRRNIFLGRMLEHAWWYPDYQLRLFRPSRGRFEARAVHEHVVVDGEVVELRETLMHENLKGIDAFLERHVRYARLEAAEFTSGRETENRGSFVGNWFERRRALKHHVWRRLRHRPAIRFLWLYVVRRGFLDGRQGRIYCQLIAAYESMIDAYVLELETGPPPGTSLPT